jgi:hypothetical protein
MEYHCFFICDSPHQGQSLLIGNHEVELSLCKVMSTSNGTIWRVATLDGSQVSIQNDSDFGGTGLFLGTDDNATIFLAPEAHPWKIMHTDHISPTSPGSIIKGHTNSGVLELVPVQHISAESSWWQIIYQPDPQQPAPNQGGLVIVGTQDIEEDKLKTTV